MTKSRMAACDGLEGGGWNEVEVAEVGEDIDDENVDNDNSVGDCEVGSNAG